MFANPKRIFIFGLVALFTLSAIVYLAAWRTTSDVAKLERFVDAQREYRAHLSEAVSLLKDAEVAARSYVLTGKASFLKPYSETISLLPAKLGLLSIEIRENSTHDSLMNNIEAGLNQELRELKQLIELKANNVDQDTLTQTLEDHRQTTERVNSLTSQLDGSLFSATTYDLHKTRTDLYSVQAYFPILGLLMLSGFILLFVQVVRLFSTEELLFLSNERLIENEQLVNVVLTNMADAALYFDKDYKLLLVNPAGRALFGEHIGMQKQASAWTMAFNSYFADKRTLVPLEMQPALRALNGETVRSAEIYLQSKTGAGGMFVSVDASPVRNPKGEVIGAVCITRNIDKQKLLELELVTARDAALKTSMIKSQFLANMSHEIRTPLGVIMGMSELIEDGEIIEEIHGLNKHIMDSASHLLDLFNEVLDFSKIESGKFEIEMETVNVRDLVTGVVDMLTPDARAKNLELKSEIADKVPQNIDGDASRIRQVLLNLINNAIKFTENGSVRVQCAMKGESTLAITVSDSGIGIDPELQTQIFQPFVQADISNTRKFGGVGLGLSICKSLVHLMRGSITFESAPSKGSTFCVDLPIRS
jgi:signal transduction histidine kinase/CHASE3 domain sensor protein